MGCWREHRSPGWPFACLSWSLFSSLLLLYCQSQETPFLKHPWQPASCSFGQQKTVGWEEGEVKVSLCLWRSNAAEAVSSGFTPTGPLWPASARQSPQWHLIQPECVGFWKYHQISVRYWVLLNFYWLWFHIFAWHDFAYMYIKHPSNSGPWSTQEYLPFPRPHTRPFSELQDAATVRWCISKCEVML